MVHFVWKCGDFGAIDWFKKNTRHDGLEYMIKSKCLGESARIAELTFKKKL